MPSVLSHLFVIVASLASGVPAAADCSEDAPGGSCMDEEESPARAARLLVQVKAAQALAVRDPDAFEDDFTTPLPDAPTAAPPTMPPAKCCDRLTAPCLACKKGMTVAAFCQTIPDSARPYYEGCAEAGLEERKKLERERTARQEAALAAELERQKAQKREEELARRAAEAEAEALVRKAAEERAERKAAEEEAARKAAEEQAARLAAEEEAARKAAEEQAKRAAEEAAAAARKAAEEKIAREAAEKEEAARLAAEEKATRKAAQEQAARKAKEAAPAAAPSAFKAPEQLCQPEWSQCGGKEFSASVGSACCLEGLHCVVVNEWYSQCQKAGTASGSARAPQAPQAPPAAHPAPQEEEQKEDNDGREKRDEGEDEEEDDDGIIEDGIVTPRNEEDSGEDEEDEADEEVEEDECDCEMPDFCQYSLITELDAQVTANSIYRGIAIGGDLFDGSPNEGGDISSHCAECPMTVYGRCDEGACGAAPDYRNGSFAWQGLGGRPEVGKTGVTFEELIRIANKARNGTYPGDGNCEWFRVYVAARDGGNFSNADFCEDPEGCMGESKGCALAVFPGARQVTLTGDAAGRQFGPSVFAPAADVVISASAGFVDGYLVAGSLQADDHAGNIQLHGDCYRGPVRCC